MHLRNITISFHIIALLSISLPAMAYIDEREVPKLAREGNVEAQTTLGRWYENGAWMYDVKKDHNKAVFWYKKAAAQGYGLAEYSLGSWYDNYAHNYAEAIMWYKKAAAHDIPSAQIILGELYEGGEKIEKNLSEAKKYYTQSCNNGWLPSCDSQYYLEQKGVR